MRAHICPKVVGRIYPVLLSFDRSGPIVCMQPENRPRGVSHLQDLIASASGIGHDPVDIHVDACSRHQRHRPSHVKRFRLTLRHLYRDTCELHRTIVPYLHHYSCFLNCFPRLLFHKVSSPPDTTCRRSSTSIPKISRKSAQQGKICRVLPASNNGDADNCRQRGLRHQYRRKKTVATLNPVTMTLATTTDSSDDDEYDGNENNGIDINSSGDNGTPRRRRRRQRIVSIVTFLTSSFVCHLGTSQRILQAAIPFLVPKL